MGASAAVIGAGPEDRRQIGLFWLLQTIARLNTSAGVVVSAPFGAVLIWRVWFRLCSAVLRFGCCFVTAGGMAAAAGAAAGDTLMRFDGWRYSTL